MKATIYNTQGKEAGSIDLPETIFGRKWNSDLVQQVVVSMASNARNTIADTKDRSMVRGGGKKPWKQKGTGRARHGSTRSPIWSGGGVAHGPHKEEDYSKKINKKMKRAALFTVLSKKLKEGEILFVEKFLMDAPKTKGALETLKNVSSISGFEKVLTKKTNSVLIALPGVSEATIRSFKNFGNVEVEEVRNLNVDDVLRYKHIIFAEPTESVQVLQERTSKVTSK